MLNESKDVGFIGDAVTFIENAVAAENHAFNSYAMTGNADFLKIAKKIRRNRSELLNDLCPEDYGESYCLMKHFAVMAMTNKELASRMSEVNNEKQAAKYLSWAFYYEQAFVSLSKVEGGEKDAVRKKTSKSPKTS